MKWKMIGCMTLWFVMAAHAQTVTVTSSAADGLDLIAVADLFRKANDAESMELALNNENRGINNLDLNEDGYVDYIRVKALWDGSTHVVVLQAALGENEYQDVASIEVEAREGEYYVQVRGNTQIYGPDYYVHPVGVNWNMVSFVGWLYHPKYQVYRSPYRWGYYHRHYKRWAPLENRVYRQKVVTRYTRRGVTYKVVKTSRVQGAKKVYPVARTSVKVRKTLRQPTASQKKYQSRTKTKAVKSGGFGKKTKKVKTQKTKTVKTQNKTNVKRKKK